MIGAESYRIAFATKQVPHETVSNIGFDFIVKSLTLHDCVLFLDGCGWGCCDVLAKLSWILLIRQPQTLMVDLSRYKLHITTFYRHSVAAKNAVPRI